MIIKIWYPWVLRSLVKLSPLPGTTTISFFQFKLARTWAVDFLAYTRRLLLQDGHIYIIKSSGHLTASLRWATKTAEELCYAPETLLFCKASFLSLKVTSLIRERVTLHQTFVGDDFTRIRLHSSDWAHALVTKLVLRRTVWTSL